MSFPCLCPTLRGGMVENPSTSALQSRTQLLKLWLVTPTGSWKDIFLFQNLQQPRTQNQAHNEFQSTLGVWGEDDTCVRNNIVGLLRGDWGIKPLPSGFGASTFTSWAISLAALAGNTTHTLRTGPAIMALNTDTHRLKHLIMVYYALWRFSVHMRPSFF